MTDITLPDLLVISSRSSFRLRCHAAAWSSECGGPEQDGLVMLSAVGADTAAKAIRAMLHSPEIEAEFRLDDTPILSRARFADKPVSYAAAVSRLAPGAVHLVALAKIPGLMPDLSDDHLWAELTGPRYSTPLLRSWTGWLKRAMMESGGILMADGHNANVGVLTTKPEELDELVSSGVRSGYLKMKA